MSASAQPKVLRIGVIQGGKIIEERHLRRREDVTVGQDARSTIVVPASNLPPAFTVFEQRAGAYSLVFTAGMDGRVRVKDQDLDLAAVRERGLAQSRGDVFVLPLPETAKGRISLGEVTLLFQFVTPVPEQARPALPPEIKGTFLSGFDRLFLTVLAATLAVHFTCGTGIILAPTPVERELELDELPDRFAKLLIPNKPPEEKKPEVAKGPSEAEKPVEKEKPAEKEKEVAEAAPPSKERIEIAKKRVAKMGLVGALSAAGGSVADVLGGSNGLATDFASALDGVSGVNVATANDVVGGQGPKGGGAGTVAGIGDLGTSGGGKVDLGQKADVAVRGRVSDAAPEVESADVDRGALTRYVKSRLKAIQSCYERELKRNPSLKGKVLVRFTIGTNGRLTEIDIEENTLGNDTVAQCIRSLMRTWAFPFRPEDEVPVSYPFVFAPAS